MSPEETIVEDTAVEALEQKGSFRDIEVLHYRKSTREAIGEVQPTRTMG